MGGLGQLGNQEEPQQPLQKRGATARKHLYRHEKPYESRGSHVRFCERLVVKFPPAYSTTGQGEPRTAGCQCPPDQEAEERRVDH